MAAGDRGAESETAGEAGESPLGSRSHSARRICLEKGAQAKGALTTDPRSLPASRDRKAKKRARQRCVGQEMGKD